MKRGDVIETERIDGSKRMGIVLDYDTKHNMYAVLLGASKIWCEIKDGKLIERDAWNILVEQMGKDIAFDIDKEIINFLGRPVPTYVRVKK